MGYGDDLMVTALASQVKKKYPNRQIVIGNVAKKQAYHSIVYDNNPNITDCRLIDKTKPIHIIDYHSGNRPYINYKKSKDSKKYFWNKSFKPTPGEIYFTENEKKKSYLILKKAINDWNKRNTQKFKSIIFLETSSTKIDDSQFSIKHKNKDWGNENWSKLINKLNNDFLIIQPKHDKSKLFENVYVTETINFREACAVLSNCDLFLGHEGGFGHASAALEKKAIVYFGGWIPPEVTGYSFHENIYYESIQSPCGEFKKICSHCEDARKNIKVDNLEERIRKVLSSK